jgi:uncharacterized protein involved in cysteine biosynthesis
LNIIPVLGSAAYITVNGYWTGFGAHWYYFELKGLDFKEGLRFVQRNRSGYVGFGVVSTALESIPLLNSIFVFSNLVGAALWACDLEESGLGPVKEVEAGQQQQQGQQLGGPQPVALVTSGNGRR